MRKTSTPVTDFNSYLASVPSEAQFGLIKLHAAIKAAAPKAEEIISYGIPSFKQGYMLVGLGTAKNHNSLYVMSPALMKQMKEELAPYKTATATINFPFDKPLPVTLVKKIVKARIEENEERAAIKGKKK
jgi:uncharacterized protein YdhG (YjbR/CyaY superfamily)